MKIKKKNVIDILLWIFSPILYLPYGILRIAEKKDVSILVAMSFATIALLYQPIETSDFFTLQKIYTDFTKYGREAFVMHQSHSQGFFTNVLYFFSNYLIPYRVIVIVTTFMTYIGILKIIKLQNNRQIQLVKFGFLFWGLFFYLVTHIIAGIRYPLAVVLLNLGLLELNNKKYIYYIIAFLLHFGIAPFVIMAFISEYRVKNKLLKIIPWICIGVSFFVKSTLIFFLPVVAKFGNTSLYNKAIKYTLGKNADLITTGKWQILLVILCFIILAVYVLFKRKYNNKIDQFLIISLSYLFLVHSFKEIFFRGILAIGMIGIMRMSYVKPKNKYIIAFSRVLYIGMGLGAFILFIRTIIFNIEPYFYLNIFSIFLRSDIN